jgi:hypothetical protein
MAVPRFSEEQSRSSAVARHGVYTPRSRENYGLQSELGIEIVPHERHLTRAVELDDPHDRDLHPFVADEMTVNTFGPDW